MNPAPLPYQQAYQPVVAGQRRTKYALHKARLGLRISATAIAVLAFILDIVGGVTYNQYNYNGYYSYYYYWPIAGSTMVSDPLFFQSRPNRLTNWGPLDTHRRYLERRRVHHSMRE